MNTHNLDTLIPGQNYRVRVRVTTMDLDARNIRHAVSTTQLRRFIRTEQRFGAIPCAVFSSRITRRSGHGGELSVPNYDLVSAEAAA